MGVPLDRVILKRILPYKRSTFDVLPYERVAYSFSDLLYKRVNFLVLMHLIKGWVMNLEMAFDQK